MHMLVGVVVPSEYVVANLYGDVQIKSIFEEWIEDEMEYYDENLEREEHEIECSCRYWKTRAKIAEKIKEVVGDYNDVLDQWKKSYAYVVKAEMDPEWENGSEYHQEWLKLLEGLNEKRKLVIDLIYDGKDFKEEADPDCEDCHGTGVRMTTMNDDGKWDYYTLGGRWEGSEDFIDGYYDKISNILQRWAEGNVFVSYALLSEFDGWIENGYSDKYFGQNEHSDEEWEKLIYELLTQYKDDYLVLVDIHC